MLFLHVGYDCWRLAIFSAGDIRTAHHVRIIGIEADVIRRRERDTIEEIRLPVELLVRFTAVELPVTQDLSLEFQGQIDIHRGPVPWQAR